jgi:hypothetical protein
MTVLLTFSISSTCFGKCLPIFRSARLCFAVWVIMHKICLQVAWMREHPHPSYRPTTWVHYTSNRKTQSSAPEDGQNNYPKHVELTGIINKPLLLHLVGCLYYLYQWSTVKQISDNEIYLLIKYIKSILWRVAKCLSYIEEARCLRLIVSSNEVPWCKRWVTCLSPRRPGWDSDPASVKRMVNTVAFDQVFVLVVRFYGSPYHCTNGP